MFKIITLILLFLSLLLGACAPQQVEVVKEVVITATPEPENQQLEIFHWWTAPGEREAADAMFDALHAKYPDIEVIENPVPGGGGSSHRVVLQARVTAGMPPDTFQTLGGAELKNYVDNGVLEPLDDLWQEIGYYDVVPGPLAKAVSVDGHPYGVPLNMHIQNILYYNIKLFDELGLEPPANFEDLLAACEAIAVAKPDMDCLGLGSQEKWGDTFVFDSLLLEEGGAQYYVRFFKGEIDVANDDTFRAALEKFEQLIPYINENHADLTWDKSVALVGSEDAAMVIMGTWAIGSFVTGAGWEAGVDFGAVTFPMEPKRIMLFHPDTYGLTVGAPNRAVTLKWLEIAASAELQVPTDIIQGGLFARTDIDPSVFPDPIRQEMQTFVAQNPGALILDQHGSILPAAAQPVFWDIISTFLMEPDIDAAIEAVSDMLTTYDVKEASAWYQWP